MGIKKKYIRKRPLTGPQHGGDILRNFRLMFSPSSNRQQIWVNMGLVPLFNLQITPDNIPILPF